MFDNSQNTSQPSNSATLSEADTRADDPDGPDENPDNQPTLF